MREALGYAREKEWIAIHALVRTYARLLIAFAEGGKTWEAERGVFEGLATIKMEDRAKDKLM